MKFSIITCNRNNEKWLYNHIKSIQNQTFTDYEHIIVDDASSDESINIIKNHVDKTKTKVFIRNEQVFALKNHILGLKQASGDIIVHLDGDDWFYDSNTLEIVAEVYEKENCLATYGGWVDSLNPSRIQTHPHPTNVVSDVRKHKHWYFTHLRTFKRELAKAINGMDLFDKNGNTNNIGADAALLTSIYEYALHAGKAIHINKPLMCYNSSTGQNDCVVNLEKQIKTANNILNSKYISYNLWK